MGIATTSTITAGPRQLSDQNPIGTVMGASPTDLIGFFGIAQGVAQNGTPAGYSTYQTPGSTTGTFINSATTGGVGSTQYTFGDVVAILKTLGLLKS